MPLADLSAELFFHIASFFRHHDLVRLNVVNRDLNRLVEPLIWTHIELHMPDHHRLCGDDAPLLDHVPRQRPYRFLPPEEHVSASMYGLHGLNGMYETAADMFFTDLNVLYPLENNTRARQRCKATRSLSAPVVGTGYIPPENLDGQVLLFNIWNTLTYFVNLERLELSVHWLEPHQSSPFALPTEPLRKLRIVRLMGYVPALFVNYIIRSSATIESLDLGLLDAPIGGTLCDPRVNPPPNFGDHNAETDSESEEEIRWHVEGSQGDESEDDFDYEGIAPRSLPWMPAILPAMPRLTHLRLCKPGEIDEGFLPSGIELKWSTKSEAQCLREWAGLLRNVQSSLQCLVLEQRPATVERERRFSTNDQFMKEVQQPSTSRLIDAIEPVFKGGNYPALKEVLFCGLLNESNPAASELKDRLVSLCDSKGFRYQFQLGKRCIVDPDSGETWNNYVATDGMGVEDLDNDLI